jgi:hypothetical protein
VLGGEGLTPKGLGTLGTRIKEMQFGKWSQGN